MYSMPERSSFVEAAVKLAGDKQNELREAFKFVDYDQDGLIFTRDVSRVIRYVGLKPSESEIKQIMQDIDKNGGTVDLRTLSQLISRSVTQPENIRPDDYNEMFAMYDREGRGSIPVSEMIHLLTSIGEKLTEDEAQDLLKISGCVSGGVVDYKKFVRAILN